MGQPVTIGHLLHQAVTVYLRPYWGMHVPLVIAVAAAVVFETCYPLTMRFLIDGALIPQDLDHLKLALVALVALFALAAASRFVVAVIRAYMNAELNKDIRVMLAQVIRRLPMGYLDRAEPGQFAPLYDTELVTFTRMLRDLFSRGCHAILQFAVIIATMFFLNWQMALLVLLLLPLIVLPPKRRFAVTVDAQDRIRKTIERVNSAVTDHVASQPLVRAFGRGDEEERRFIEEVVGRKGARPPFRRFKDVRRTLGIPHFLMQSFRLSMDNQQAVITLLVIGTGAGLTFVGTLSLGTYSAFILLLPGVMRAISELADYTQDLGRATLSLERLERVRDATQPVPDADAAATLQQPAHAIRFEQVCFGYGEQDTQIRDIDLSLPIGQSVAFVGRSGTGKSTLFKLLLGFYAPVSGRVTIDDHDVRELSQASLGAHVGTVLQDSPLTNASIRDNIRFAKPGATDEEVGRAARMAGIHDYIASLPNGYDSGAGEGGKWLSEGQRQRISLARALLPEPAILLLDEVTSALDPETEQAINATIQQLAKERTVLLVSHRLTAVAFVDKLVVLDQGRVAEQGRHEELLARGGLYRRLWEMQSGFEISADGHHAEVRGERLQAIPLFRDVDIASLDSLAERFVSQFYRPGDSIYTEGEPGNRFYIVVRGTVSITRLNAAHQPIRLANLQDGDYFGEVEMLGRGQRTTSVTAITPTLLLALDADDFGAMMNELSSLNRIVTQMALGRSLSTICSVGRRHRSHPIWQELIRID